MNDNNPNPNISQDQLIEKNKRLVINANNPYVEKLEIKDESQLNQFEELMV